MTNIIGNNEGSRGTLFLKGFFLLFYFDVKIISFLLFHSLPQEQVPICFLFSFSCCYYNGLSRLYSHQKSWFGEAAMKHLKV